MEDELDEEYDNKNELKELLIALVKELDEELSELPFWAEEELGKEDECKSELDELEYELNEEFMRTNSISSCIEAWISLKPEYFKKINLGWLVK